MPPPSAYAARTRGSVKTRVMPRKLLAEPFLHRVGQVRRDLISFRSVRGDHFEIALGTRGIEDGAVHRLDGELALAGDVGIGPAANLYGIEQIARLRVAENRRVRAHVVPRRLDIPVLGAGPLHLQTLAREPAYHFGDEPRGRGVDDVDLRLGIRHEARARGNGSTGNQKQNRKMSNDQCPMSKYVDI